eukprot:Hpha_TRINITY_DN4887_c0_g1::TRINITY_DN4887_c0_g1_i1::g.20312::m.20312
MGAKASSPPGTESHEPVPSTPLEWSIGDAAPREPPPLLPENFPVLLWKPGREVWIRTLMPDHTPVARYCRHFLKYPKVSPYAWQQEQEIYIGLPGFLVERVESLCLLRFDDKTSWWPVRSLLGSTILAPPAVPHLPRREDKTADKLPIGLQRRATLWGGAQVYDERRRHSSKTEHCSAPGSSPRASPRRNSRMDLVERLTRDRRQSAVPVMMVKRHKTPIQVGDWVELKHMDWGSRFGVLVNNPGERKWVPWGTDDSNEDDTIEGSQASAGGARRTSAATRETPGSANAVANDPENPEKAKQEKREWFVHWVFDDGQVQQVPRTVQSLRPKRGQIAEAWWQSVFEPWAEDQKAIWMEHQVGDITDVDPNACDLIEAARKKALERSRRDKAAGQALGSPDSPQAGSKLFNQSQQRKSVSTATTSALASPSEQPGPRVRWNTGVPRGRGPSIDTAMSAQKRSSEAVSQDGALSVGARGAGRVAESDSEDEMEDGPYLPQPPGQGVPVGQWLKAYDEWWIKSYRRFWQHHLISYLTEEQKSLEIAARGETEASVSGISRRSMGPQAATKASKRDFERPQLNSPDAEHPGMTEPFAPNGKHPGWSEGHSEEPDASPSAPCPTPSLGVE